MLQQYVEFLPQKNLITTSHIKPTLKREAAVDENCIINLIFDSISKLSTLTAFESTVLGLKVKLREV